MTIEDRKKREFKRREEEILDAAYDLFAEKGLEGVTIEMIAEAAEIGKGTIYKHFNTKHEIFASLAIRRGIMTLENITHGIDRSGPILDQIRKLVRIIWDKFIEDPKGYYIHKKCETVLSVNDLSQEVFEKLNTIKLHHVSFAQELIQQGINEGVLMDEPVEHLFLIGYGLILGTIELLDVYPVEDRERLYQLMENVIIDGMLKK